MEELSSCVASAWSVYTHRKAHCHPLPTQRSLKLRSTNPDCKSESICSVTHMKEGALIITSMYIVGAKLIGGGNTGSSLVTMFLVLLTGASSHN